MNSVKEVINFPLSSYKGSEVTREMVKEEIERRYGAEEIASYDPYKNARTFSSWLSLGFRVKNGEKAIKSFSIIEVKDAEGLVTKKIRRMVNLFYVKQVEPVA